MLDPVEKGMSYETSMNSLKKLFQMTLIWLCPHGIEWKQ